MDAMIQLYMEETEDMLQKAEECIMRLEIEYSDIDINELFRIAHTIKGSSHMVGYADIGNLMHKIEDMLDCVRNGSIIFDMSIVSLCLEGLDAVKKMLQYKNEQGSQEIMDNIIKNASRINEMIEEFISFNKKEEEKAIIIEPEIGIVSSCLNKGPKGRNKYYITFFMEEDVPMVSPVLMMILNTVNDVGSLLYSSVGDSYFSGSCGDEEIKTFDIILSTDIDEAEMYTYFSLFYIEKINIVNLSRSTVEENDYSFIENDDTLYVIILKTLMKLYKIVFVISKEFKINKEDIYIMQSLHSASVKAFNKIKNTNAIHNFIIDFNGLHNNIIEICDGQLEADEEFCKHIREKLIDLIERFYQYSKGKYIFSVFKSEEDGFISKLKKFIEMLNKTSTIILLINLGELTVMDENQVKDLIEIKRQLESKDIEIGIILGGLNDRKIVNIFDSIKQVEEFHVYRSELHAILGIFNSDESIDRINRKLKDVHYE